MTRVLLVHESKYGNIKLVAKIITEGVREGGCVLTFPKNDILIRDKE